MNHTFYGPIRIASFLILHFCYATCVFSSLHAQPHSMQGSLESGRDIIDFENVAFGQNLSLIPIFSAQGFGAISLDLVYSHSGILTIFDSSCPGAICSGNEYDLGTPNETFGGPGKGEGGEAGQTYANAFSHGHVLIVHGGGVSTLDDPNSSAGPACFNLVFPVPVTIYRIDVVDVDTTDFVRFRLFDAALSGNGLFTQYCGTRPLAGMTPFRAPITGRNGVAVVQTDAAETGMGTSGVLTLSIRTQGSFAIDNIVFSVDETSYQPALASVSAYPNPFNPSTTISLMLAKSAPVRLTIYDVLGREVERLVDSALEAGLYEVTFDASDLPSGTYIYRLVTPWQDVSHSLLLLK